jgi:ribosomal protein S18 acetylase RimI-like enzyme
MPMILHASLKDIPVIRSLAEETWWPTYSPIISIEQIRYMLDTIYSAEELSRVMKNGSQTFILLSDENGPQGYASFGLRPENQQICKLHKLYVLPENHGKGYGKMLVDEVIKRLLPGVKYLELNVNRYNKAKDFYERIGFKIVREEDVSVGPYWMNDYVMRMDLPD